MIYAADTQIYTHFDPYDNDSKDAAIRSIQKCINEIKMWMTANYLKLNEDKTEIIIISNNGSKKHLVESIERGGHYIYPVNTGKNLGVLYNGNLNFSAQIDNVCKNAFFMLRRISRIRRYFTTDATKTSVHSLISSKLDYCNSLLFGLPKCKLHKLERVMHCAARVISGMKCYELITEVLIKLHWLPIPKRIEYKIILLTFKSLNSLGPTYLSDLLEQYIPARSLRSCDENLLVIPKSRLKSYGDRSFAFAAPSLWNSLPSNLRNVKNIDTFKGMLKTYLFKESYGV